MKTFGLNFGTVVLRFYLMMMVIIAAGFIGQWWLALLALPIFLSAMLGIRTGSKIESTSAAIHTLPKKQNIARKAV